MNDRHPIRRASPADAATVAELLHDFNVEFDTPTPRVEVLAGRLARLLDGDADAGLVALLHGRPATGLAVLSFRPNVWYPGPVALLDELYVRPDLRGRRIGHALLEAACDTARGRGARLLEIGVDGEDVDARRFYEAHGFTHTEPGATEPTYWYHREW